MYTLDQLTTLDTNPRPLIEAALEENHGVLRLAPCWVPRSFLHPGRRLKLHPDDLYAFGLNRGGIDERWFASTTEAANDGRVHDEGLSYIVHRDQRVLLRDAIEEVGPMIIGSCLWNTYKRWPVYSKFFDNMGPIPLHMHQSNEQAAMVGQEGKPEGYYFPPQHNRAGNHFPYTFFGLIPGTTRSQLRDCLANWNNGDNRILDLSQAHQLKPGSGWIVPPGVLHAPGSFCTYEPQWGSDVFGMYQNLVEGREVPWSLLVKDMPPEKHDDLDFIIDQLDWETNTDPNFKANHYLEPTPAIDSTLRTDGFEDKWIVYGTMNDRQFFSAKELTVAPESTCTVTDAGAYGATVVQGEGSINSVRVSSPSQIRFRELTQDECFVTESAAREGVSFTNTSEVEPLVILRYFGPDVHSDMPEPPGRAQ